MDYNGYFDKALALCVKTHTGQTDKGGYPYLLHPLYVAAQFNDLPTKIVALLHDVVEDGNTTIADIKKEFPADIAAAVAALTRDPAEDYCAMWAILNTVAAIWLLG